MRRLVPPLLLHVFFLAAVAGGIALALPKLPGVAPATGVAWQVTAVGKTAFAWGARPPQANNLSGMAWLGGDRYALVSDKGGHVLWAEIQLDPGTGAVASARILPEVARVAGARDLEDVTLARDGSLVVCDEEDASLARVPAQWGQGGSLAPSVRNAWIFRDCRTNLSLEAVAAAGDGLGFWTVSEDALVRDGARAGLQTDPAVHAGAWLRLVRTDAGLRVLRQWAYRSDPVPGHFPLPLMVSGVAGLLELPDGRLLILERALGVGGFRLRLYLADPAAEIPDVAAVADLSKAEGVVPLAKSLLGEWDGRANGEGIALGPELADGDRAILVVTDDGDRISKSGILVFRLRRKAPLR